jgi:hypothetical protein
LEGVASFLLEEDSVGLVSDEDTADTAGGGEVGTAAVAVATGCLRGDAEATAAAVLTRSLAKAGAAEVLAFFFLAAAAWCGAAGTAAAAGDRGAAASAADEDGVAAGEGMEAAVPFLLLDDGGEATVDAGSFFVDACLLLVLERGGDAIAASAAFDAGTVGSALRGEATAGAAGRGDLIAALELVAGAEEAA